MNFVVSPIENDILIYGGHSVTKDPNKPFKDYVTSDRRRIVTLIFNPVALSIMAKKPKLSYPSRFLQCQSYSCSDNLIP
jgi:hypothetical protein